MNYSTPSPSTSLKNIKVFLVNGIFNTPPHITTSKDILSTKAHYVLEPPFIIEEPCSLVLPSNEKHLVLSGDINLYIQYVSKDLYGSIKQHYCVLPFCEYLTIPSDAQHYLSPVPQLSIEDIFFHVLDDNFIYYSLSVIALT